MSRNLTLRLDETTIRQAKVLAARRGTSVSALIAGEVDRIVREDHLYESNHQRALSQLENGCHLGGAHTLRRELLHER